MADSSEFESICPYNDAEAVEALNKVANHPAVLAISEYLNIRQVLLCDSYITNHTKRLIKNIYHYLTK